MDYVEAFALADNPFGPKSVPAGIAPNLIDALEAKPILTHRAAGLEYLYCANAGLFQKHGTEFERLLRRRGYHLEPPKLGGSSMTVVIHGDAGTGKTTLASHMVQTLLQHAQPGVPAWQPVFEAFLDFNKPASVQLERLAALRDTVKRATSEPTYACILVDDVLEGAYQEALSLREELSAELNRVFFCFITTRDPALLAKPLAESLARPEVFRMNAISDEEAVAFVRHRIAKYRVESPGGIAPDDLFPFTPEDVKQAVGTGVFRDGVVSGPITLRVVSRTLHDALEDRLTELDDGPPDFDVRKLASADLPSNRIRVAQAYRLMVAAA